MREKKLENNMRYIPLISENVRTKSEDMNWITDETEKEVVLSTLTNAASIGRFQPKTAYLYTTLADFLSRFNPSNWSVMLNASICCSVTLRNVPTVNFMVMRKIRNVKNFLLEQEDFMFNRSGQEFLVWIITGSLLVSNRVPVTLETHFFA